MQNFLITLQWGCRDLRGVSLRATMGAMVCRFGLLGLAKILDPCLDLCFCLSKLGSCMGYYILLSIFLEHFLT